MASHVGPLGRTSGGRTSMLKLSSTICGYRGCTPSTGSGGPNPSVTSNTSSTSVIPVVFATEGDAQQLQVNSNLGYVPSSGILKSVSFEGDGSKLTNLPAPSVAADASSTSASPITFTAPGTPSQPLRVHPNSLVYTPSSGTLVAPYFQGDGSKLTSLPHPTVMAENTNQAGIPIVFAPIAANQQLMADSNLAYTPSTGNLKSASFEGDGSKLTNLPSSGGTSYWKLGEMKTPGPQPNTYQIRPTVPGQSGKTDPAVYIGPDAGYEKGDAATAVISCENGTWAATPLKLVGNINREALTIEGKGIQGGWTGQYWKNSAEKLYQRFYSRSTPSSTSISFSWQWDAESPATPVSTFVMNFVGMKVYSSAGLLSSDARLKTDVKPLTGAMELLSKVRMVSYQKANKLGSNVRREEIGVIAQEIQDITELGHLVQQDENDGNADPVRHTDYTSLHNLGLAAVQELMAEVVALKARVAALEAQQKP